MKQIILLTLTLSFIFTSKLEGVETYKIDYKPETKEHYSPAAAAGLNFILPSSGFFYSKSYGWATTQLVVLGAGMLFFGIGAAMSSAGQERCREQGGGECWDGLDGLGQLMIGSGLLTAGWIGGVIIAPIVASNRNNEMDAAASNPVSQSSVPDTYGLKVALSF